MRTRIGLPLGLLPLALEARAFTATIEFSAVPDAALGVPLSPWLSVGLGLLVMGLAFWKLRASPWRGPLVLAMTALGLATVQGDLIPNINAAPIGVTSFPLTFPSPMVSPVVRLGVDIEALNVTGQTIKINSTNPTSWFFFALTRPLTHSPSCKDGPVLPPGGSCYFVLYMAP